MRISLTLVLAVILSSSLHAAGNEPRPLVFGMNIGMSDQECELARAAGCTSVRIGCGWDLVEREPGKYDFSAPDHDVAQCEKYGFEPFFLIVATPPFYLEEHMRDKVWGWPALPKYYPEAEKFYRTLAARYKGRVKYYEFWNEENGYSWHAINKPEEYAPILKIAYKALKAEDPGCLVAVGGLDGAGWKGYYHYLEKLYDLGCGDYFDAVAVHPYRADGPIDVYGLKSVRNVLLRHGHADRKIWITEYGWSNEYGHDVKAKWLEQSLDSLTSPQLDYVFQASVHTLTDFDRTEYGLCKNPTECRPGYYAFKRYPKDWKEVVKRHAASTPRNQAGFQFEDFESPAVKWVRYGDRLRVQDAESFGIKAEVGNKILLAAAVDNPLKGGVYRRIETTPGVPISMDTRGYTDQKCDSARNSQVRVGIDPTGGIDPEGSCVVWGKWKDTSGEWDSVGVGLGKPILPPGGIVTLFLEFKHEGGACGQVSAFDNIEVVACEEAFVLPEVPTK